MVKFGFIGIGIMGRGMAMNLVQKGFDITVGGPSPLLAAPAPLHHAPITHWRGGSGRCMGGAEDAGKSAIENVAGPSGAQLLRPRQ